MEDISSVDKRGGTLLADILSPRSKIGAGVGEQGGGLSWHSRRNHKMIDQGRRASAALFRSCTGGGRERKLHSIRYRR
jgi:hypothetical protein